MNGETTENSSIFSQTAIDNFVAFSSTLKRIHNRLISEGYTIKDGKITKPEVDKKAPKCAIIKP
jgi:hypothetical protein